LRASEGRKDILGAQTGKGGGESLRGSKVWSTGRKLGKLKPHCGKNKNADRGLYESPQSLDSEHWGRDTSSTCSQEASNW